MKKVVNMMFTLGTAGILCLGGVLINRRKEKELDRAKELIYKNDKIIQVFDQFLTIKQEGKDLSLFFKENGYKKVAIYGVGYLGKRICDELISADVEVVYFIDKSVENMEKMLPIFKPEQKLPAADVVIVTPVFYFHSIEIELEKYVNCPIISIEDVLDEALLSEY